MATDAPACRRRRRRREGSGRWEGRGRGQKSGDEGEDRRDSARKPTKCMGHACAQRPGAATKRSKKTRRAAPPRLELALCDANWTLDAVLRVLHVLRGRCDAAFTCLAVRGGALLLFVVVVVVAGTVYGTTHCSCCTRTMVASSYFLTRAPPPWRTIVLRVLRPRVLRPLGSSAWQPA